MKTKMTLSFRHFARALLGNFLLLGSAQGQVPSAQPSMEPSMEPSLEPSMEPTRGPIDCGDTITRDRKLKASLICDCLRGENVTEAVLTVVGATLDLNGFEVSCDDNSYIKGDLGSIIELTGKGATLRGGTVKGGNFGIRIAGKGSHLVNFVDVISTGNDGIHIGSNQNTVENCKLEDNGGSSVGSLIGDWGDGIAMEAGTKRNFIRKNTITNYADDAIDCAGNHHAIELNLIEGSNKPGARDGIVVAGSKNLVSRNTIKEPPGSGIDVKYEGDDGDCPAERTGSKNIISSNVVKSPGGVGINIRSDSNLVESNDVARCKDNGIAVDKGECTNDGTNPSIGGNKNKFKSNLSRNNKKHGFKIEGESNKFISNIGRNNNWNGFKILEKKNVFKKNSASDNFLDFEDTTFSGNCGSSENKYKKNKGGTVDPSCIID